VLAAVIGNETVTRLADGWYEHRFGIVYRRFHAMR
jgi:hypothetical protein